MALKLRFQAREQKRHVRLIAGSDGLEYVALCSLHAFHMETLCFRQLEDESACGRPPVHLSRDGEENILRHVEPMLCGIARQHQIACLLRCRGELVLQVGSLLSVAHDELDRRTALPHESSEIFLPQMVQPLVAVHHPSRVNRTP